VFRQQAVAPVERRAQRLLSRKGRSLSAPENAKPLVQLLCEKVDAQAFVAPKGAQIVQGSAPPVAGK